MRALGLKAELEGLLEGGDTYNIKLWVTKLAFGEFPGPERQPVRLGMEVRIPIVKDKPGGIFLVVPWLDSIISQCRGPRV